MADPIIKIDWSEVEALSQELINKAPKKITLANNKAMTASVLFVQSKIPGYPPPPPESKYRRTGQLGRSVTAMQGRNPDALSRVEPGFFGTIGYVGTKLKYTPFVIDEDNQARAHQGRWYTLQQVLRNSRAGIVKIYNKMFKGILK